MIAVQIVRLGSVWRSIAPRSLTRARGEMFGHNGTCSAQCVEFVLAEQIDEVRAHPCNVRRRCVDEKRKTLISQNCVLTTTIFIARDAAH